MRSAARAYGTIATQTAAPRELEASLLLKAASRLQAVQNSWDTAKDQLDDALRYNRKLWTIFLTAVTSTDNPMPTEVRQNVANLGLFVMKQSVSMLADPKPESLNTLININRELAAGLLGRA